MFDFRSFLGFTCLIQISTRAKDYVVDTLALRNHLGAALAAPFANEQILKVLHGADRDIEWLQKDFGLFVVNMFDTGKAARILNLPCGLGKLLNQLCHVTVRLLHVLLLPMFVTPCTGVTLVGSSSVFAEEPDALFGFPAL